MKITLRSMEVQEWLGRKFVGGVYATQEIFQADMLNRALVQLCAQRSAAEAQDFMRLQHETALGMTNATAFDAPTQRAFSECAAANHPVLALSLLRLARVELQLLEFCQQQGVGEQAYKEVAEYLSPKLSIGLYAGGAKAGKSDRVFNMNGKRLLQHKVEVHWYFNESLNVPYAVEAGLLFTGQLILAKCYAVRDLAKMLQEIHLETISNRDKQKDERFNLFWQQVEDARYACLERQIRHCFIVLTGFRDGQHGLPREEARAVADRRPSKAA